MKDIYKNNRIVRILDGPEKTKYDAIKARGGNNAALTDRQLLEEIHGLLLILVGGSVYENN